MADFDDYFKSINPKFHIRVQGNTDPQPSCGSIALRDPEPFELVELGFVKIGERFKQSCGAPKLINIYKHPNGTITEIDMGWQ